MDHIHHKDQLPKKTVGQIQDILTQVGFKLENRKIIWRKAFNNCFSCTLVYLDYPFLRSNGKGLTKEYALASAYGEFMERLQGFAEEFFFNFQEIISNKTAFFHPYKFLSKHVLKKRYPFLFKDFPEEDFALIEDKLPSLSFCNLTKNTLEYLPYPFMTLSTRSNGMCAGNSQEEAVAQGICEVFERHILDKLSHKEITSLPTIPISKLSLDSLRVKSLIQEIEKKGIFYYSKGLYFRW